MAAPQLRLAFAAYLRGFLQSDYPQGRQSRIREVLLCRAMDREQQGVSLIAAAQANMELLASMPCKSGGDLLRVHSEAVRMMTIGYDLTQQYPAGAAEADLAKVNVEPIQRMAELLNVLKVSNIKDILPLD